MTKSKIRTLTTLAMAIALAATGFPGRLPGQAGSAAKPPADSARMADMADHAMSGPMDVNMMKHMELTPPRPATHDDTVRANRVVAELREALSKYQDTAAAVAEGYHMFMPQLKNQRIYHFTNNGRGFLEAFRFDPAKPTSILYKPGADGRLHLVGAMYTMPKNARPDRLDQRVPLSIARWHKHVNWCLPKKGPNTAARWTETKNGAPVFGPGSPIATKSECDAVGGQFHANVFGWMLHANVYEGNDLGAIFGDEHK